MNKWVTEVFVEQPLASPGSAKWGGLLNCNLSPEQKSLLIEPPVQAAAAVAVEPVRQHPVAPREGVLQDVDDVGGIRLQPWAVPRLEQQCLPAPVVGHQDAGGEAEGVDNVEGSHGGSCPLVAVEEMVLKAANREVAA